MVDCVFKALFGQEENKGLLIHFLNAILRPASDITEITYQNPINDPRTETEKLTIIDIRALDQRGVTYQVEMQLVIHKALPERMLYNWTALYQRQMNAGEDFDKLAPVISIWLLGNNLLDTPAHHHHFQVRDAVNGIRLSDHLHIHTLELRKWAPPPSHSPSPEDLWLHFFRDARSWTELPDPLTQHPQMRQAMTVLKHFSDDDKARYEYERRMQIQSIQATIDKEIAEKTSLLAQQTTLIEQKTALIEQKTALIEQYEAKIQASESQIDDLQAKTDQAKAQADQAKAQADQAKAQADQAKAQADQAKAQADQAKAQLEQTKSLAEQRERQTLLQSMRAVYTARLGEVPGDINKALEGATLEQLTAWFPSFLNGADAQALLALCKG
jgi:predicted transposase/invertase (TIGR01784 family)